MTAGVELLTTPDPHLIPGYVGYLPQYRFRCGGTYGTLSHELLVDPTVNHSPLLVVSSRTPEDYEVYRPSRKDIYIVNDRYKRTDPLYKHHMVPGYEGFVPRLQALSGQRFGAQATEALAEFEKQQLEQRYQSDEFRNKLFLENIERELTNAAKKRVEKDLECTCSDSSKIPLKISIECDLKAYHKMQGSKGWPSETKSKSEPPLTIQPTGIYPKHAGLTPNYLGHVPGAAFRIGKTFGVATRNAKQWLS